MIYLDHAAATACAAEVVEAMLPFFRERFANPASIDHLAGNEAKLAVEDARSAVAALVQARPEDVIFTSGSTEANNLALSVSVRALTTAVEHPSVLEPYAARADAAGGLIPVDANGIVDIEQLAARLDDKAETLVSVIATNNETGVEQDVDGIARLVSAAKGMLHLDATQCVGTRDLSISSTLGLVGVSVSAHKIHGPKGVGALIAAGALRRRLRAVQRGGSHERGLRSGTLNVPGIVGFGVAARLVIERRVIRRSQLTELRRTFLDVIRSGLGRQVEETVADVSTSPHILSLRFRGTNGRALLRTLRNEVAFSLGSACATNKAEPSHVLLAMGVEKQAITETVRLSFAADQDAESIQRAGLLFVEAVQALSGYSLTA